MAWASGEARVSSSWHTSVGTQAVIMPRRGPPSRPHRHSSHNCQGCASSTVETFWDLWRLSKLCQLLPSPVPAAPQPTTLPASVKVETACLTNCAPSVSETFSCQGPRPLHTPTYTPPTLSRRPTSPTAIRPCRLHHAADPPPPPHFPDSPPSSTPDPSSPPRPSRTPPGISWRTAPSGPRWSPPTGRTGSCRPPPPSAWRATLQTWPPPPHTPCSSPPAPPAPWCTSPRPSRPPAAPGPTRRPWGDREDHRSGQPPKGPEVRARAARAAPDGRARRGSFTCAHAWNPTARSHWSRDVHTTRACGRWHTRTPCCTQWRGGALTSSTLMPGSTPCSSSTSTNLRPAWVLWYSVSLNMITPLTYGPMGAV